MASVEIFLLIGLLLPAANWWPVIEAAPAAGASTSKASRVKQLVEHFELIERSSHDIKAAQSMNVILSLSESASKLYKQSHGLAQDGKCSRYVGLISMPDVRTVATISALAKESGSLNEQVQSDANLIASLISEREFDSMNRIQLIIQTLESERTLGKSNFEPGVERELLNCVNYYVYRQQRALLSVIEHTQNLMENLSKHLIKPTKSDIFLDKIQELLEQVVNIEQGDDHKSEFNYDDWLDSLSKLQTLVEQNDFEIPEIARDFLADRRRIDRLNLWLESDDLKNQILEAEPNLSLFNRRSIINQAYRMAIQKLNELCSNSNMRSRPPKENCKILSESKRSKVVKEISKDQVRREERSVEPQKQLDHPEPVTSSNQPDNKDPQQETVSQREGEHKLLSESDQSSGPPTLETLFDDAWSLPSDKRQMESPVSEVLQSPSEVNRSDSNQQTKPKKRWFW